MTHLPETVVGIRTGEFDGARIFGHTFDYDSAPAGRRQVPPVTVHGRPSAILIAPEDLAALEETLEIMRDAGTMNRLAESDAELARGEYVSAEELAEAMRRRQAR
jgi:PHD/YefM family antitoxin component YafN of YafNO toxin-antitoxin module